MKKNNVGIYIIASAIIWGAAIIACAVVLKGTPYKDDVSYILTGGTFFHLLFIWGPLAAGLKKNKSE